MHVYLLCIRINSEWHFVAASFSAARLKETADALFGEALAVPLHWIETADCATAALDYSVERRHYEAVCVRRVIVDGERWHANTDGIDTSWLSDGCDGREA